VERTDRSATSGAWGLRSRLCSFALNSYARLGHACLTPSGSRSPLKLARIGQREVASQKSGISARTWSVVAPVAVHCISACTQRGSNPRRSAKNGVRGVLAVPPRGLCILAA
jgi:hypothetical protein